MERYDVILVNPPWSKLGSGLEHLGLGYMAACLREKNYNVLILDFTINPCSIRAAVEEIEKYSSGLVGVSIPFQEAAAEAFDLISQLKERNPALHVNIGGIYPTFSYEEIMRLFPAIDSITLGEGEETIVELTAAIKDKRDWGEILGISYRAGGKVIANQLRPSVKELDSIPFPARDTLPDIFIKLGFVSMITSRGCYGRCSFCSVDSYYAQIGPKFRLRSWENVIKEIELLYNSYGVRNIIFNDANFIGGKGPGFARARRIAEEIIDRGLDLEFRFQCRANDVDEELFGLLKKAGLSRVYLGIESGSQTMLDRFQKDISVEENMEAIKILSKLDMFISMGFIMFDEKVTMVELEENNRFIKEVKSIVHKDKLGNIYPLSRVLPLAGTKVESQLKENNNYTGNSLKNSYRIKDPVVRFIYNGLSVFANFFWDIKRWIGKPGDPNKEWSGGWRKL